MQSGDSGRFQYLGELDRRIASLEASLKAALDDRVEPLETYMWKGNGKPGMITRMALMEETVGKINKNLGKIVWLMVATLSAVLVKLFVK